MKIDHALWLTALLACTTGVSAQTCSGGPGGGMDATGNECSVAQAPAVDVDPRAWAQLSARLVPHLPARASAFVRDAAPLDTTGQAQALMAVPPAGAEMQTCSDGTGGGMDVTGNECSVAVGAAAGFDAVT